MIVNGRCTALALLFATSAGAYAQSQARPESPQPPPPQHFQVSPWVYVDAIDTQTVRADGASVENGRPAPVSLNNGSGQFTLAGGPQGDPINAALADMDGDSVPDLAIARRTGVSLLMRGNGIGGFHLATPLPGTESGAFSIGAADIDADGDTDIALAGMDGHDGIVLLNNGWGEFTPHPVTGSAGTYVQIGLDDFTGDGQVDIALYAASGEGPLFAGNGAGQFRRTGSLASLAKIVDITGMADLTAGPDFEGDAPWDIPFRILIAPVSGAGPEYAVGLALNDANGDGMADLIVGKSGNE
jgi:hypothetical protein